jgi:hypothetical protein
MAQWSSQPPKERKVQGSNPDGYKAAGKPNKAFLRFKLIFVDYECLKNENKGLSPQKYVFKICF